MTNTSTKLANTNSYFFIEPNSNLNEIENLNENEQIAVTYQ